MSAIQIKTTPTETAQQVARSIWKSLALLCLLALSALPGLAQDLGVTQTGLPQPVGAGTNITYTITVTNSDSVNPATVVTLTDTLPSQVTYVSNSGGCVNLSGVVTCSLGTIGPNGSATITIVASTACGSIGSVTNTAVANEVETDTNPANNTNVLVSTVADLTAPAITCSGNVTADCTSPSGAVVSYSNATAIDNCDGAPTISCSPASGSTFAVGSTTVTCIAYDASLHTNSCSFQVVVSGPVSATALTSSTNCPGTTATFGPTVPSGTGPFTYSWTKNGTVIPGSNSDTLTISLPSAPSSVVGTNAGTYCVIVAGACKSVTNCATLTIPGLIVTCSPNLTNECAGPTGANVSYTTTVTNVCDPTASVSCVPASGSLFGFGVTTVTCTANDVFLNTNTCSFSITVRDSTPPTVTCTPNQTICPTNLAGVAAIPDFTIGLVISDTCSGIFFTNQTPAAGLTATSGTTNIIVSVRDSFNNTNYCTNVLVILTNTSATLASLTNCLGTPATFSAVASGSGPFTYTWVTNGVTNGTVTGSTYSIGSVAATDAGSYCVIVQGACTLATNCATLTVAAAPVITAQPQSQQTPMGNGAVFTVSATPVTTLGYQWRSNGVNLVNGPNVVGATTATLAVSNVSLSMNGTAYTVVVSNCVSMVTSTPPAVLTVTVVSGIAFDFDTPGQFTNTSYNIGGGLATYNIGNNYWMNNVLPTVPFEATTGGVTTNGVTSGAIDFLNQNTTDETSTCLAQTFDFSLSNKTLIASAMFKLKLGNPPSLNARAIQFGFGVATNVANVWQGGINGNNGQGFMTAIVQSTVSNNATSLSFSLRAQTKLVSGTATTEVTPINTVTNPLTVGNWYKLVATFVNARGPGIQSSNYTVAATLQDMGPSGTNVTGPLALVMPAQTQQNPDIVTSKNLLLSLRSAAEAAGVDLVDNIYVQTTTGPAFFVTPPASQTVGVGQRAKFSAYVDGDGPYSYQWNKNGVPIPGARQWQYTTPPLTSGDNTASFTCSVTTSNLPPQVPVTVTSAPAIITIAPGTLAVATVGSIDGFSVGLQFNQAVDPVTAAVAANYSINGGPAYQVSVRPDLKSVVLIPSPSFSGTFTVTVSNVKDVNNVAISGPGATATGTVAGLIGIDVNPAVAIPSGQNFSFASNSFEISGGGVDIWNNADSYRYVYRTNAGDFDVQVHIPYIDIVRGSSKAGFVARDSLDPSCPMVCAAVDPPLPARNFYEGTTRASYNIFAVSWGNTTPASFPDAWLRFRRVANTFHRYSSTNGTNWTYDGQVSQKLQDTVLLGLGACSVLNVAGQPVRANLDNFGNFPGYSGATIGLLANPTNATVASGASGTIFMSANITNAPLYELSYIWQRTNILGGWTNMFVAGTTNNFFSTGPMFDEDNGALYRAILTAPGVASVTSGVAVVTVADAPNPLLTSVQIRDIAPPLTSFQLLLTFSEDMTMLSATNVANYTVTNGLGVSMGVVSAVVMSGDPRTVILTTSSPLITGNYGVVVNNVRDANNISVPANSTLNFVQRITSPLAPIVQEWYLNQSAAGSIRDLLLDVRGRYAGTGSTNYTGANPDYTTYSNFFGVNAFGPVPSSFDNYSVRSYSYFVPTNTGPYIFFLRGDDFVEFFMNTNSVGSTNVADYVVGVSNVLGDNTFNFHTNNSGVTQQPYFGMDNRAVTKFLGGGTNVGLIVKPAIGATVVNGIRFTTANDAQERDPNLFTLEGSTAADPRFGPWVQIAVGSTGLINSNINNARLTQAPDVVFTNAAGAFTNTTFYTSYRILFPGLRSTNAAGAFVANQLCQIGEIGLLGTNGVSNTPFKIIPSGAVVQIAMTANSATFNPVNSFTNILTAGQKYYMECRFKEQTGGDASAVAFRTGSNTNVPSVLEAIPASLCSFPTGLAVPQTVVAEIYRGAGPGQTIGAGGTFTSGSALVDMTNAFLSFNAANRLPDTLCFRPDFGFATNLVDTLMNNYVGKIYSYFTPPSNGLYRFWMRSDDSSQLFMNTNAVNSSLTNGMVSLGAINAFTAAYIAEAQNVPLFATNLYYIEARWKDGGGGDGVQVAVRAQSDANTPGVGEDIPPSMLRYPTNAVPVRSAKLRFLSSLTPVNPTVSDGQTVSFTAGGLDGDLGGGVGVIWFKNGQQVAFNGGVGAAAYTNTFITQPLSPADNGAVFTVRITNLFDSVEQSSTVTVNPDATRPTLLSAVGSQYNDRITLRFSEASGLDPVTARFIPNYAIPGLTVTNVLLDVSRTLVLLQTTPQTPGTHYSLTVGGVKDGSFEQNVMATTNVTVSAWAFGGSGTFIELYTNIGINVSTLNGLTNDTKYTFNATDTNGYGSSFGFGGPALPLNSSISDFLGTVFTGNGMENYGCRVSGLFVAPSNGYYRFYLASDDASAFFMNTNAVNSEVPQLRQQLINVASANLSYTNPLSVSTQLFLAGGQRYYMEEMFKEGTGGDYVHATFRPTDVAGTLLFNDPPIASTVAETIPGTFFVPPGNPDALSVAQGLPGSTNILQNRLMTLAPALNPPSASKIALVQWQRSTDNTCTTFTNIPGANKVTYSQYVDLPDDGFCFRIGLSLPGVNFTNTTTLHVIPDTVAPQMLSAGSIDPFHVGVVFNERMDFADAHGAAGDYQLYFVLDTDYNLFDVFNGIVTRTSDGGMSAILSLDHALPIGRTLVLAQGDFADLAGNETGYDGSNPDTTTAPFTVMNLVATNIGTYISAPNAAGVGNYNNDASVVDPYPLNPFPSTNGGYDVTANGWDIWNATDGFHFDWLNRPMTGDFDLKVRVQRLDGADQWSKAGLMARGSLNGNSRWIYVVTTPTTTPVNGQVPNNFTSFQWRDTDGGTLGNSNGVPPVAYPNAWVRLQRVGNVFHGYQSSNAVDWVEVGNRDTLATGSPFPETLYFGLCAVSHDQLPDSLTRNAYAEFRDLYIPIEQPTITAQPGPASQSVVVHSTVSYSVTATNPANSGPLVYQWLKNGVAIPGATGPSITLADLKVIDSGNYSVTPANDGGGTPSVVLSLTVTNILPVTMPESLIATQGMTYTFTAADLLGNDFDPDTDTLTLVSVSGVGLNAPQVATNFDQGILTGSTLYGGSPTGGVWLAAGGVGGSGGLQINSAALNNAGSYVIDELTPGNPVNSFVVSFNLRIGDGTAEPADGMSVNFASDLPNAATSAAAAEQGAGSGFSFCIDDYRFFPAPIIGQPASSANGGTNNTSGMKIIYHGLNVAVQQCPTFAANPVFVPVTITVSDSGIATVMVNGTNVFGNVILPGYAPTTGRFGFYGRDGGQGESHTIDDLSITLNPHQLTALGGTVSLNNGIVTYIAPTNACGPDIFYYTISDGQLGGTVLDHVSIVVYPTNNTAPVIASCPTNRTIAVGATCQAALPDLTGDFLIVDQCSGVIKTQSPAAGTISGLGTTLVTLTASNIVGSNVTCQMYVTNADLTAPSITCPADIIAECTGNGANVSYSVSSSDNCSTPIVNCTPLPSGGHFPLGTNLVNCTSTDAAGNVSSCSFKVIVLDTTAPSLTCPNVVAQCTSPAGANVSFTPSVVEACDPSPVVACTPASGSAFGFGATPVHCTATDATGNIGSCDFTVTVHDVLPPSFVCPANQTNECTGAGGAVGTYITPSATDTCDPSPTVSCSPPSGATFAIGTNTVTCIAYDVSLNTNTCTFKIITVDTTPPSISCSTDKSVECGTGWSFDPPTALDTCGATHIHNLGTVTNATCGNTFTATRTWNFTDDAGNTSVNCSQTVTVVDTIAPTITCSPNVTNNCTSVNGAVVTFTVTASDTCGPNPTPACIPASGSTFSIGVHTVDCVATDACNNSSSHCTFTVTVKDTASAPTMTIVQSGSNVIISWPATCTTYRLQRSTSLPTWSDFTSTTVLIGSTYYSTNAINTSARFYRLINP